MWARMGFIVRVPIRWGRATCLYANGVSYQAYYSEVGKAGHKGKDLTEARSLYRKFMLDKWYAGPDKDETTSMHGITTES